MRMHLQLLICVVAGVGLSACTNIGPETVTRDRFDYNEAIARSWKEQTLLNIVKLRYADMPLFVEVASVVSGYSLEGNVNLGGTVSSQNAVQGNFLALGSQGKYTDRPTITYAPITGSQFNKSFMQPVPPAALLFLMQSGWPIDLIFPITVDSINGLRSRLAAGANQRDGDPKYYRVIQLLREIQQAGATGMRIKADTEGPDTTILLFHIEHISPEIKAKIDEVDRLLGIRKRSDEVIVTYGFLPRADNEIAMITRSMLQIMVDLATQVDVPPEHVADGRTVPSLPPPSEAVLELGRIFNVRSGEQPPDDAFTAVKYRDVWYWIEDGDWITKRTFAFLMILFSMTETGGREGLPLVTIPTS